MATAAPAGCPLGDSGAGRLSVAVFVLAFIAAGINLILLACGAGWLLMRSASRDQ